MSAAGDECNRVRTGMVYRAAERAVEDLNRAMSRLDSYIQSPGDAANRDVVRALSRCFNARNDPTVAGHVRGRLQRVREDLRNIRRFSIRCPDDAICRDRASAYVPGGQQETISFCPTYFRDDTPASRARTILHEMAHAQVGGRHITDRGYITDRIIVLLPTAESLTNAASYEFFVWELNRRLPIHVHRGVSFDDCPDDWQRALRLATARAELYNLHGRLATTTLDLQSVQRWGLQRRRWLGGASQQNVDRLRGIFRLAEERFEWRSVPFECESQAEASCTQPLHWRGRLGDIQVCRSWMDLDPGERIVEVLAAVYERWGRGLSRNHALGFARLAEDFSTREWQVPTSLSDVLGDPAWTPDLLSISFRLEGGPTRFWEGGGQSTRFSQAVPVYPGVGSHRRPLHGPGWMVQFRVDSRERPRPLPFTPPHTSIRFDYRTRVGVRTLVNLFDNRPNYRQPGAELRVQGLSVNNRLEFLDRGVLDVRIVLHDPDSGRTVEYRDQITVDPPFLSRVREPGRMR